MTDTLKPRKIHNNKAHIQDYQVLLTELAHFNAEQRDYVPVYEQQEIDRN